MCKLRVWFHRPVIVKAVLPHMIYTCVFYMTIFFWRAYIGFPKIVVNQGKFLENTTQFGKGMHKCLALTRLDYVILKSMSCNFSEMQCLKITKAYFYKIVYVAILQRGYKVRSGPYRLRIRMFALRTLIGTYEQFKDKIFYTINDNHNSSRVSRTVFRMTL